MSNALLERIAERTTSDWIVLDAHAQIVESSSEDLAEWEVEDPIDELLTELRRLGRGREAGLVARTLRDREDETIQDLFLNLMEESLAEDWNSEDDDIYNDM